MDAHDDNDTDADDDNAADGADLGAAARTHELLYHIAWPVANAPAELDTEVTTGLREILHKVAGQQGVTVQEARITTSYIYLVVEPQPHHSPRQLVTWFKNVSAKRFEQTYPDNNGVMTWADGSFAGTGGDGARAAVRRYLEARLDDNSTLE